MDPGKNETVSPTTDFSTRRSLPALSDEFLFLRVSVPDLNIQKCFQFNRNQNIGDIKEQCIASLPLELKQSFNYGLFCPPTGAKCGKFLDENKALNEYPYSDYVGYLELRFKQRIYKSSKMDEKQFKAVNTRTNLRRFIDYIQNGQIEKVTKMSNKGIDPNFHCVDTGETPLTLACTLADPSKMLLALIEGGALLDFRDLSGSTPLHRAVESNNIEAVITLLELGSSPNSKDTRGLTPLYLSISRKTDVSICEMLLHNKATIGAQDVQGWQEIHQACRYGLYQHLEHLLFYGADINAKNASGNTPLHVCAVNGQDSCAKLLLHKGAQNDALNFANQSPYQVAVIAGNLDLASIIQNFRSPDAEKSIGDCSDVISNNSSGIGTANSDFTESNFSIKVNDTANSSGSSSGIAGDALSPVGLKARNRYSCCESSTDPLILPVYRPSQNLKERMTNCNKYYATAPRQKHQLPAEPRTVVLHKTKRGFGFILRGAKATSSLMDVKSSGACTALQYLDDVDKGSVADLAGLRKGDYLLAINGEDVSSASHEKVVDLIRNSGKLVTMTVVSRSPSNVPATLDAKYNEWQTSAPLGYATLPNKLRKHRSSSAGHIVAPLPPRRDPKTTLSVGKANSRNIFTKPGQWEAEDKSQTDGVSKETQPKTASIRSRPISSRITTAELEELFQRQAELSPVYQDHQFRYDEHATNGKAVEKGELRRNFYSVPDLVQITICNNKAGEPLSNSLRNHKSQDNVNESDGQSADGTSSTSSMKSCSSTVKIKSNKNKTATLLANNAPPARTTTIGVNSSFNPNNNAVIYACPSDLGGFKEYQNGSATVNRNQVRKSASIHSHSSLRPNRIVAGAQPANHYSNGAVVGVVSGGGVGINGGGGGGGVRYKNVLANRNSYCFSPPPIPDPDYSQSDEESEQNKKAYKTSTLPLPGSRKMLANKVTVRAAAIDTAANATQSFNVEEIRKARSLLRSSTTFSPNYTTLINTATEDGDNSSSGVSSDQEISAAALNGDKLSLNSSSSTTNTSKSSSSSTTNTSKSSSSSFIQLPPLGSTDTSAICEPKPGDLVVLPPPEFVGNVIPAAVVEVLEPPPQFSDDQTCK